MTEPKHTMQASTPQEFKEVVVKWLNSQAVEHRATARNAKTARFQKEHTDKADTLEYTAKFIYEIVIEGQIDIPFIKQDKSFLTTASDPPRCNTHPWEYEVFERNIAVDYELLLAVRYWVKHERMIEAMKCYRYHTNASLLDANNYVEKLKDSLTNQTI